MKTNKPTQTKTPIMKPMMAKFNHKCSCGVVYSDDDPDVYFCPSCIEQRKKIASIVDAKLVGKVSKRQANGFEAICEMGLTKPSANGGLATFLRASDLGL